MELDTLEKRLHKHIRHGLGIKLLIAESHSSPILELQNTINSHDISIESQIHNNDVLIRGETETE